MFSAPTTYIRLAAVGVLALVVVGGYLYVTGLQDAVKALTAEVKTAKDERDAAIGQVQQLTEAKSAVEARQVQAELAARKLRGDLARARGRVQTVTIPTDCDAALNWIAEELK